MGNNVSEKIRLSVLLDHPYPSNLFGLNSILLINDNAYVFVLTELKHDIII